MGRGRKATDCVSCSAILLMCSLGPSQTWPTRAGAVNRSGPAAGRPTKPRSNSSSSIWRPPERADRDKTDFLAYTAADGTTADFHSLRHRFVPDLVNNGVQPKDAMGLARHSSITMTMDRYAHVGIRDTAAAVAKLSLPSNQPDAESQVLRATGTDPTGPNR